MANDNYDFGGHIEDDRDVNPSPYTEDEEICLSPLGYLIAQLGRERGKKTFDGLARLAGQPCKEHGGTPGLAFDVVGGRFIAILSPDAQDVE